MNMTIKAKLFLNIAAAALAIGSLIAISNIGLTRLAHLQDEGAQRATDSSDGFEAASLGAEMYQIIADAVINRNLAESEKNWAKIKQESIADIDKITSLADTPEEKRWADEAHQGINAVISLYENKMLPLLKSDTGQSWARIREIDGEIDAQAEKISVNMEQFAQSMLKEAKEADAEFDATGKSTIRNSIITGILILAFLVAISLWILFSVLRQLGGEPDYAAEAVGKISRGDLSMELALKAGDNSSLLYSLKTMQDNLREIVNNDVGRVLQALSHGDLTQRINKDYPGVFGQLKDNANTTVDNLKEIISQVKDSTGLITTASSEIAQGNADLSQRTEEQASSLEETASSMEELTSTVKQNAENAKQANQLSMSASDIAVKGGHVVNDVVNTMASISASSKKMMDIISVIEGIAFQTNILALNAAVEAARAGEQGRGFAVVAAEVRNLAQRSAAAAKEIKSLIDDSVDKVDNGSKLVDQAGATMTEIVNAVKRVTDIMSEIAAASAEQSAGIGQVNQAVVQMDEVTQQNAALVEEAASAAESMQEQANVLMNVVDTFKLDESKTVSRTAIAHHAPHHGPRHAPASAPAIRKERQLARTKDDKEKDWKEF